MAAAGVQREEASTQRWQQQQRSPQPFPVLFPFLEGCGGPVARVAGLGGFLSCFRVLAASDAAVGSHKPRRRASPSQQWHEDWCWRAKRDHLSNHPPRRERTTERSEVVRASGNEVFALRDKTGTRQCLVAVTGTLCPPGFSSVARTGLSPGQRRWSACCLSGSRLWRLAICKRAELSEDRQRFLWTFPT